MKVRSLPASEVSVFKTALAALNDGLYANADFQAVYAVTDDAETLRGHVVRANYGQVRFPGKSRSKIEWLVCWPDKTWWSFRQSKRDAVAQLLSGKTEYLQIKKLVDTDGTVSYWTPC